MKTAQNADGFSLNNGNSRPIKDAKIWYSNDGVNFVSAGSYVFQKTSGTQYLAFTSKLSFRYFKIVAKTRWDGTDFAQFFEIGIYAN